MLTELHIENLGVIERAALRIGSGLTALTGETGAGKTMLVEAIELLVGGRADSSIVRAGAAEARVDGRLLVRRGDELEEIVLTRVIPADGRSRAYVDGRPATVAHLADITAGEIDLHGQHAHQSLLSGPAQRAALDCFGAVDLTALRTARARVTEIDAELAALGGDEKARAREIDLLRFQVAELDAAGLEDADEDTELSRQESLLGDAVAHREAGLQALEALRGEGGSGDSLAAALHALANRQPFERLADRLAALSAELDDVVAELRADAEAIDEDPERLAAIRERRQLLKDLRRKYGDDLAEVLDYHAEVARRLDELERYEQRAAELDTARQGALAEERRQAELVGRRRRAVAPELAAEVERRLRTLALPHASIAVEVGEDADDHPGDRVTFLLSANPGSPLLPLSRVASGGELARAMLALRLALLGTGDDRQPRTLVFDEVDAGIGGTAAVAVGNALAELSGDDNQVLVVTHLAQVAACADHQLVVSKQVDGGLTYTSVAAVEGEPRVAEIARMLSGADTEAALEHARQLLDGDRV
jgi:DNA repair protein RecN (Recombination protein N)